MATATATKPAPQIKPKAYVFGGTEGKPQGGANARRLWAYLQENLTRHNLSAVKHRVAELQAERDDRFIRWYTIVEAAEELEVTAKDGTAINRALVRRLAKQENAEQIGRDASITIL